MYLEEGSGDPRRDRILKGAIVSTGCSLLMCLAFYGVAVYLVANMPILKSCKYCDGDYPSRAYILHSMD